MITSKDFWNMRSQNYDAQVGTYYKEAYDKTVSQTLEYVTREDRILEFACGTGTVTVRVAPHVSSIRAIDISDQMVVQAREKAETLGISNVEISQTDLFDPCLQPGSFDAVMAFNVLCYMENLPQVLERIRSLLKPGGVFLSATDCLGQKLTRAGIRKFIKIHRGEMPYEAFLTTKQLEQAIADAGFTILDRSIHFPAPPNLYIAARK